MIFRQWREIVEHLKTETRRVCKLNEFAEYDVTTGNIIRVLTRWGAEDRRLKWYVGQRLPIMTGRGKPTLWRWKHNGASGEERTQVAYSVGALDDIYCERCYITITSLAREPLHAITEAGAVREGVGSVEEYRTLYESINGKGSWDANPDVWIVGFSYEE